MQQQITTSFKDPGIGNAMNDENMNEECSCVFFKGGIISFY